MVWIVQLYLLGFYASYFSWSGSSVFYVLAPKRLTTAPRYTCCVFAVYSLPLLAELRLAKLIWCVVSSMNKMWRKIFCFSFVCWRHVDVFVRRASLICSVSLHIFCFKMANAHCWTWHSWMDAGIQEFLMNLDYVSSKTGNFGIPNSGFRCVCTAGEENTPTFKG